MRLIAITGGIGSGKSMVSRILRVMGHEVYDSDSRAKWLMNHDPDLVASIKLAFGSETYDPAGQLNRMRLSQLVFGNDAALQQLNSLVHPAVKAHLVQWAEATGREFVFVETAIPHSSGLAQMVNATWRVEAPEAVRVSRVMLRSGLTEAQVRSRIKAQEAELAAGPRETRLINDDKTALLPQVQAALQALSGS